MSFWITQALNGISFGMVLFLIASGLSLIAGLMRIVNLAHGAFYLWGTYLAISILKSTDNRLLAILGGVVIVAIGGAIIERFFIRRFSGDHFSQILLTLGFTFILADLALLIWGGDPRLLVKPASFAASLSIGGVVFPSYRILMITVGILVAIGLWLFQDKTRIGALIRAGVDDTEMARGLGINIPLLFTAVFGLGVALSAFGGIIAGPLLGAYPGLEWETLLLGLAVLLIGGEGSLKGAFIGSLLVGIADNFGKTLVPVLAMFIIFGCVAVVLAFRPSGLFGKS
ncbi:MAG: branched-chain amino acid ABC transporter permease [Chloroflexi bacterium]|nr:branched-chain amino acid ABC transporter permease [Chloroflexota bacterium]